MRDGTATGGGRAPRGSNGGSPVQEPIWLPSLQVWARAPRSTSAVDQPLGAEHGRETWQGSPPKQPRTDVIGHQGAELGSDIWEVFSNTDSQSDEDLNGCGVRVELPSCPICLNDILNPKDKAVVEPCLHIFCRPCVHRWLQHKSVCPLCKRDVRSYIHSIESDQEYSRHVVLPKNSERDAARSLVDMETFPVSYRRAGERVGPGPGTTRRPEAVTASRSGSASTSQGGLREPRPYFYRVQRACQRFSVPQFEGPTVGTGIAARYQRPLSQQTHSDSAQLEWRRQLYSDGRWVSGLSSRPSRLATDDIVRQQHLRQWITRELKALLQEEDVSFLTMYILGLWGSNKPSDTRVSTSSSRGAASGRQGYNLSAYLQGRSRGEEAISDELLASLIPFLGQNSLHFWHKLKCFALASCAVAVYDNLVCYPERIFRSGGVPAEEASTAGQQARAAGELRPAAPFRPTMAGQDADAAEALADAPSVDPDGRGRSDEPLRLRKRLRRDSPDSDTNHRRTAQPSCPRTPQDEMEVHSHRHQKQKRRRERTPGRRSRASQRAGRHSMRQEEDSTARLLSPADTAIAEGPALHQLPDLPGQGSDGHDRWEMWTPKDTDGRILD